MDKKKVEMRIRFRPPLYEEERKPTLFSARHYKDTPLPPTCTDPPVLNLANPEHLRRPYTKKKGNQPFPHARHARDMPLPPTRTDLPVLNLAYNKKHLIQQMENKMLQQQQKTAATNQKKAIETSK